MEASIAIKLFSLIPGLKSWAIRRFSKIEITPINSQGNNIFSRLSENEKQFFVKTLFNLKSYTAVDILDLRLNYRNGFRLKKIVNFNNEDLEIDGNYRLNTSKRIEPGEIYKVFISETFLSKYEEDDFGEVKIELDISAPEIPGISTKYLVFKLSPGGCLSPEGTQKVRMF